jgi:hypothetical protein
VLEAGACSSLFTVRIELVFERNTSGKSEFSRWSKPPVAVKKLIPLN